MTTIADWQDSALVTAEHPINALVPKFVDVTRRNIKHTLTT